MTKILLDLNSPLFQEHLFSLEKEEQRAILACLKKIKGLTWQTLYTDPGLKWEAIASKKGPKGSRLYSFRFSKKYRGVAYREDEFIVVLGVFSDHDKAYTSFK